MHSAEKPLQSNYLLRPKSSNTSGGPAKTCMSGFVRCFFFMPSTASICPQNPGPTLAHRFHSRVMKSCSNGATKRPFLCFSQRGRSEERRGGEEGKTLWVAYHL